MGFDTADLPEGHRAVAEQMVRLVRILHSMKAAVHQEDELRDKAAYGLLFPLLRKGALRASELSEFQHSDPSTVSRHVNALIGKNLIERVPDQNDGRASLLALTAEGERLCHTLMERRAKLMSEALINWTQDDLADFAAYIDRFSTDIERTNALQSTPTSLSPTEPTEPADAQAQENS